jgi:hypothetical protein
MSQINPFYTLSLVLIFIIFPSTPKSPIRSLPFRLQTNILIIIIIIITTITITILRIN